MFSITLQFFFFLIALKTSKIEFLGNFVRTSNYNTLSHKKYDTIYFTFNTQQML